MTEPAQGSEQVRIAIVTGAGSGVGRGEAKYLAARGYAVVVNDWAAEDAVADPDHLPAADQVVREIEAAGGRAVADHNDVADPVGAQALIRTAADTFGSVDVLVNNAGIHRHEPFADMPAQTWNEVLRVCLNGHVEPSRAVAQLWESTPGAGADRRIINTTSLAGLYGAAAATSAYATAKAGVIGLTWSLARELAHLGAKVNAIAPRATTGMTMNKPEYRIPEFRDRFAPERVAPLVGWLAGAQARNVTGRVFVVGGGKVWLVRPFDTYGPYPLNEDSALEAIPVQADGWELFSTGVPNWADIELRFA